MNHLQENELVEHYYAEDAPVARVEAARHLDVCPRCAQAFAALGSDLAEVAPAFDAPLRDAAWANRMWHGIQLSLAPYPPPTARRWQSWGLWQGLAYATACALLAGAAFYAGRFWEHRQQPIVAAAPPPAPAPAPQPAPVPAPKPVLVVVLADHLDRSERLLVQLKHADLESNETITPLRDEARTLLAANNVARKDARAAGNPELAKALDHLDHLLAQLAAQPQEPTPEAFARLQSELNAANLLFEVRVLRSNVPDPPAHPAVRSKGGTI